MTKKKGLSRLHKGVVKAEKTKGVKYSAYKDRKCSPRKACSMKTESGRKKTVSLILRKVRTEEKGKRRRYGES